MAPTIAAPRPFAFFEAVGLVLTVVLATPSPTTENSTLGLTQIVLPALFLKATYLE